jgi:hypothetical protein
MGKKNKKEKQEQKDILYSIAIRIPTNKVQVITYKVVDDLKTDPTWSDILLGAYSSLKAMGFFWDEEVDSKWKSLINTYDELLPYY